MSKVQSLNCQLPPSAQAGLSGRKDRNGNVWPVDQSLWLLIFFVGFFHDSVCHCQFSI